jgi:hypothetical protein
LLYSSDSPAASLVTTPADQCRLLLAFMGEGTLDGCQLVQPSTARMMLTPQVRMSEAVPNSDWWNGIGFELEHPTARDFNFGHGGAHQWGWYSYSAAFPNLDVAVVVCTNRWDLPRFYNPQPESATGLITDFIVRRLRDGNSSTSSRDEVHSWAWRASYSIGLLLVERTCGLHGTREMLEWEAVEQIAAEAVVYGADASATWDPDGFRAGVRAGQELDLTPDSIRGLLSSGRAPITVDDLPLLGLWFGHKVPLALPMPFFAGEP